MPSDDITVWLNNLKAGDSLALDAIWRSYYEKLVRLIRQRLGGLALRVADEEDIALSALNSLYDGVQAGRFPRLNDRDDLWKLLVTIACRKTNAFCDRHFAKRRGGGQVRGESALLGAGEGSGRGGFDDVLGREPTPELAAAVAETIETLLGQLEDDQLRAVATGKMEGYTNEELAVKLGCSTRTIERKLDRVRAQWSALAAGLSQADEASPATE